MRSYPNKFTRVLPSLFALAFFLQGFFGGLEKSLTWDEPVFIASGYTYLTQNDFRLNPEAPPLMQHLVALPLLWMNLEAPETTSPAWQNADHFTFARQFFHQNLTRTRDIALRSRLPVLLLGAGLILVLAAWGRALYGSVPALAAAALAAFSPNLIAHAKLATTDFGCAAFMFGAVYTFWCAVHSSSKKTWGLCGFLTGLALLAKFTALLLGPIYLILAIIRWITHKTERSSLLFGLLLAGILSILTVGAGYNFTFTPLLYLQGMGKIYSTASPNYLFYLFGEISETPWWYYHLAVFLVKTPLPILLLILLAAWRTIRNPDHREAALYLLLPALVVLAASCFDKTNLGLRRILPALPFLYLFTAQSISGAKNRFTLWGVAILITWTVVDATRIYPHHLAYFNQAAGGPERGPYLLDDSNIDWGQDLPALAAWQRSNPEAHPLNLRYFGNISPQAYGVHASPMQGNDVLSPRPGYYAISAHNLVFFRKMQKRTDHNLDWLTRYRPVARAGYSIYIYQIQ
ncbi:MAG: glycosyltransferase family 39 protein [bacterium]|nr:glycosyltransferase family 39 protein [bacterium]